MSADEPENGENLPEEAMRPEAIEELARVQERIGPHFRRAEARTRAGRLVRALLAPVERKNGGPLAEAMGERSPHGPQRRLSEADWDEEAVRDELRTYVCEHLGEPGGVLVVDETGFLKKGKKSAGVATQYSGAAYGKAKSQIGVLLLSASANVAAFLDRALYLPEEWLGDVSARSRSGSAPRPPTDRRPASWPGACWRGRLKPECQQSGWWAIPSLDRMSCAPGWKNGTSRTCWRFRKRTRVSDGRAAAPHWLSGRPLAPFRLDGALGRGGQRGDHGSTNGPGSALPEVCQEGAGTGQARFVLLRRSLSDPSQRAYSRVAGPASLTLAEVVRIAGRRWTSEEAIEEARMRGGIGSV